MSAEPLRVAFCHYTADIHGGSDKSLFDLVTHLPRNRISPLMILRHGDPLADEYIARGVPVEMVHLVPPRRAAEPLKLLRFFSSYWPSVFAIRGILRKHRIQALHVNTINNLQGPMAARVAGVPLVWHVRELVPGSRLNELMRGLVARWSTIAVANSNAVGEALAACGSKLRVVLNGIDLEEYMKLPPSEFRGELRIPADAQLVACVGRIEPWKGQHVLLDAAPKIFAAHPRAFIVFVGGPAVNKPDYAAKLRARVRVLGLAGRVLFAGVRRDIPAVMAAIDILVLPSVTAEPFGRTLVEAMAAGKAVVATRAGGPLDIVCDGETGLLVTPNSPSDLAEKVNRLLDAPEFAASLGARGREVAHGRFALARVVDEMTAIFEEAAGVAARKETA